MILGQLSSQQKLYGLEDGSDTILKSQIDVKCRENCEIYGFRVACGPTSRPYNFCWVLSWPRIIQGVFLAFIWAFHWY